MALAVDSLAGTRLLSRAMRWLVPANESTADDPKYEYTNTCIMKR